MIPRTLIVIDFETNGAQTPDGKLDLMAQRPVEVCAVRVVEGEVTSMFNTLIYYNPMDHPETGWSQALENGHHSRADLLKGMSEYKAASILWDMILGAENEPEETAEDPVLVAYNATFDYTVLKNMLERQMGHFGSLEYIDILCPLTIARDRVPKGSHKLTAMAAHYGVSLEGAHSAMEDTMALVDLLLLMDEQEEVAPYINVVGYKRQYREPTPGSYPLEVTLKPQGHETVYHSANGRATKRTNVGKPFQQQVMGKPVRSSPPVPQELLGGLSGGEPEQLTAEDMAERQQAIDALNSPLATPPARRRPAPPSPK
jgi:DNA polymerase III epsilon subunit-like protein